MSGKPVYAWQVSAKNSKLVFQYEDRLRDMLAGLEGAQLVVTIQLPEHVRTLKQNAYYWGVVLDTIADKCGHNADYLHNFFRNRYLRKYNIDVDTMQACSTTTATTKELSDYIEKIARFGAIFFHVVIPEPEEMIWHDRV